MEPQNQQQYIEKWKGYAMELQRRYGVPASLTLAQSLLESGAGTSDYAKGKNNYFGLRYGSGAYMSFRSPKDSFEYYARMLSGDSIDRYRPYTAGLDSTDVGGYLHALVKGGYSTEGKYTDAVRSLIRKYDLTRFDRQAVREFTPRERAAYNTRRMDIYKRNLLNLAGGSNNAMRRMAASEARAAGLDTTAHSRKFPKWMLLRPSSELRGDAAFWTAALHQMRLTGQKTMNFNGKTLTRERVASRAVSYANAAIRKLEIEKQPSVAMKDDRLYASTQLREYGAMDYGESVSPDAVQSRNDTRNLGMG